MNEKMTYKKPSTCGTLDPVGLSANTLKSLNSETDFGENHALDFSCLSAELSDSCKKIQDDNDLSELTNMLVTQAYVLQNLFSKMVSMATRSSGAEDIPKFVDVALKTQKQCRATIRAIAEIKNPKRATFIKQQTNQALGHMQVNNGKQLGQENLSENLENQSNKLLEKTYGERLDFRAAQTSIGINQKVETVEKVNRANNKIR
jgi:hypothetical protein